MTSKRIIGGAAAALALVASTVVITMAVNSPDVRAGAQVTAEAVSGWEQEQQAQGLAEPTETTPAPGPTLSAKDLTLTPKIIEKQCFGSAGCHVDIKVEVGYDGPALAPDDTWEVTYEVSGDESGPITQTFELAGEKYDQDEISMSTKSGKTKISVKVVDVTGIPG